MKNKICLFIVLLLSFSLHAQNWKPLFNGKDLTGWKHVGGGSRFVENGLLASKGGMGLLYWTGGKLGNCQIKVVYKMQKFNSNAGIFVKVPVEPKEEWMPVFYGYEVQIDNHPETSGEDEYHISGTLYAFTKPKSKPGKPGPEWNTMLITLDGPRTIVYLNDELVTDYREGEPVPARKFDFEPYPGRRPDFGYFGLQNHGDEDVVYFKEVSVRPLKK
ncbi:3-keto-disaccharide hydrolase [Aquirufa sp. TARAVU-A1A]